MCINSQNLKKIRSVVQLRALRSFLRAARKRFALRAQFFLLKTYSQPMCINSQNLNQIRSVVQEEIANKIRTNRHEPFILQTSGLYPLRWVLRLAISQFHKCSAHTDNDSFWDPLPLGLTPPFGRLSLGRKIRASRSVLRAARARFALRAQNFLLKTCARPMCINSQNLNKIRSVVQEEIGDIIRTHIHEPFILQTSCLYPLRWVLRLAVSRYALKFFCLKPMPDPCASTHKI